MKFNLYKKINWFSISLFIFAFSLMIIGLSLLSLDIKELNINGFGFISSLETMKNSKNSEVNGLLDVFKKIIYNLNGNIEISLFKNITAIRTGVIFTVFLTPIFGIISLSGFTYNYIIFYKNIKTPQS